MPGFAEIKKWDSVELYAKITKSSMYTIIKIYNLQEDGCSALAIFGNVSTALSFSMHWSSLNCFSFLKPKTYL